MRPPILKKIVSLILIILTGSIFILESCTDSASQKKQRSSSTADFLRQKIEQLPNTLSEQEKTEGWVLLFDGKTTSEWRGYLVDTFPDQRWDIDDASIHCKNTDDNEHVASQDIITINEYHNFELSLDWKADTGTMSGIYFLTQEKREMPIWKSSLKMQITDNANPEASQGKNGTRKSGALYDLLAAMPQNTKKIGDWNQVRIIVSDGRIEFLQNSEKILETELWNENWEQLIAKSKFKGMPEIIHAGGDNKSGHIGFQDGKTEVWFRNIKIRAMD